MYTTFKEYFTQCTVDGLQVSNYHINHRVVTIFVRLRDKYKNALCVFIIF